jgi:hypothetical protein
MTQSVTRVSSWPCGVRPWRLGDLSQKLKPGSVIVSQVRIGWSTRTNFGKGCVGILPVLLGVITAACDTGSGTEVRGSYRPPVLPVKFVWSPSGVSISGDNSIVTPIGIFSIGAQYSLPREEDSIYVIMRDRDEGVTGFDHTYKVESGSGEFIAVVDGRTTIQVANRRVLIDVTGGNVRTIEFKKAEPIVPQSTIGLVREWKEYSTSSFYAPFSLTKWAYDDSTISKWYGVGFVWFLLRLALAVFLLIFVDLPLTVVFVTAGTAYVLFGVTGRNVIYGLAALVLLLFVVFSWAAAVS